MRPMQRNHISAWQRWLVALLVLGLALGSPSAAGAIPGYPISALTTPDSSAWPTALAYGPGGAFWFSSRGSQALHSFTPPSTSASYPLEAERDPYPFDLTIGPGRAVWFTEQATGRAGRLDPVSGKLTEFVLAAAEAGLSEIAAGQDGCLWATEYNGNALARLAPDGEHTEYPLPQPGSRPLGIASDLEGNLWFTEWGGYRIGRISLAGEITEYPIPNPPARPVEIVLGPDDALWFTYDIQAMVGRVDPQTGALATYTLDTQNNALFDLALGPDGRLWYLGATHAGRFDATPTGPRKPVEVRLPEPIFGGQGRTQIIAGPGGEMEFITHNSPVVRKISGLDAGGRDVQLFTSHLPGVILTAGEFSLQAEVVNWSNTAASAVSFELTLDAGIHLVTAEADGEACGEANGHLTCTRASLAGGASWPISLTFTVDRMGAYAAQRQLVLRAYATEPDYLPANNRAVLSFTVERSIDYFNDFSQGADAHWSHPKTTAYGSLVYLGAFANDNVSLTFSELPPHDHLTLCFDLYVIGGWDGSHYLDPNAATSPAPVIGPDIWANYVDADRILVTTFSNQAGLKQAFPGNYNEEEHPARTGAIENGDFGSQGEGGDAHYSFCMKRYHTGAELKATFYGLNLEAGLSETWALDNVRVRIAYQKAFDWTYLPFLMAK